MSFKRIISIFFVLMLHVLAAAAIFHFVKPISSWYLGEKPALGVDLYNSVTYATYHLKHFSLPFNSFKDFWFGGYPLMLDFPQLSFHLMAPLAAIYGAPSGVQIFAVLSLFLIIAFSYLLFFELSKNFGLSLLLAILVLLSVNMYGALTWAGSIPYFTSQAFFPLGLLFGVKYLRKPNPKHLALMALITGAGILIHPFGMVTFLVPSLVIIIVASGLISKNSLVKTLQQLFLYISGFLLASFTFTYDFFITLFVGRKIPPIFVTPPKAATETLSPGAVEIADFYRRQITLLFSQTNSWLFIVLAAGFVFFRHQPYRAFWPFPIAVGALTAAFWGHFFSRISEQLKRLKGFPAISVNILLAFLITVVFGIFSYIVFKSDVEKVIEKLAATSELSSTFPEALSINLKKDDLEKLKKQVVPSFMDSNDKNRRLYTADATVNIWWSSLFELPLARGYLDPPIGTDRRWGFFWLDTAIANDSLVRDFGVDEEQAFANALFLIDWYGIHYFEGGRLGSKGPSPPPSSYLLENGIFNKEEEVTTYGAVLRYQTESGKPELHMELPQTLKFYKVADEHTSPILYPTNASAVIVFSDDATYEDFLRILATKNLNSRKIIPVHGGKFVDDVKEEELSFFDAVILSQYNYRSQKRVFNMLEGYVESGGKLFIDTGGEVKESESVNLPEIFPLSTTQRQEMGSSWDFTVAENEVTRKVDFSNFGPLVFNDAPWKLSVPRRTQDLREGSRVILRHKNLPILVEREFGKGQVVWSGMNLFYHYDQYKALDEANLAINILEQFVTLEENEVLKAEVSWMKPEKVLISTKDPARGVLFKEQGYDGWIARAGGKKLPIYLVGPTYPGFMYVPMGDEASGSVTVEFNYLGRPVYWFAAAVNFLVVLFLLETILFGGRFTGKKIAPHYRRAKKKLFSWWEKEEEY